MDSIFIVQKLIISEGVFVPDEESLALAESAMEYSGRFLDIGTGSGFITIALYQNGHEGDASDISDSAIACSNANFDKFGIQKNTVKSDFYSNIDQKYDIILYHPPMNSNETESERGIKSLVKRYLPKTVCDYISSVYQLVHSKKRRDGLREFIEQSQHYLEEGGILLVTMLNSDVELFNQMQDKLYQITVKRETKKYKVIEIKYT